MEQIKCYCGHTTYCDCGPLEEQPLKPLNQNKMEFRIQIKEQRNGTKRYIPQVGTPRLRIGKFDFLSVEWENIIKSGWGYMSAQLMYESHSTEQDALDTIEGYKKYIFEEEEKKTIKTTYKSIK